MLHLIATAALALTTLILSAVPTLPAGVGLRKDTGPQFPAPAGYLLPWAGGEIHAVSQGEETPFTHNGLAAYAFDFNLNYDAVVAARGGRVQFVRDDSNAGGCSAVYQSASNYVVVDHGDGTSSLYLHLAYDSALVTVGQIIERGEPLAVSGETGVTCTGIPDDLSPAPHLHFQVQRFHADSYFSQSLPVTFDDMKGDGIPREYESYVSGNYGPGKPQKVALTPRRVPRVFNPVAVPADPFLLEGHEQTPTPEPSAPPPPPPVDANGQPLPPEGATAVPVDSETPTLTPTVTATPKPAHTPTPEPPAVEPPAEAPPPGPSPTEPAEAPPPPEPTTGAQGAEPTATGG